MASMNEDDRRALALFRFAVLGPLVSARLEHGDRAALFVAASRRDHLLPDGRVVRVSARTVEAWFHAYRRGGLSALKPQSREDAGTSRSMSETVRDIVLRAKREKPRRSIRRIIRMLERAKVVKPGELTHSSVHRLLAREGISARPSRREDEDGEAFGTRVERRSYIAEHVGDLWVGDALHVHCPGSSAGEACRVTPHHRRVRSQGPEHALVVAHCHEHGRSFTQYPPGWVPYGRRALCRVTPAGCPVRSDSVDGTLLGATEDAEAASCGPVRALDRTKECSEPRGGCSLARACCSESARHCANASARRSPRVWACRCWRCTKPAAATRLCVRGASVVGC